MGMTPGMASPLFGSRRWTTLGVVGLALGGAAGLGLVVAVNPMALVVLIGALALLWFATTSLPIATGALLAVRTLSDSRFIPDQIGFGLNLLIALTVIGYAVVLIERKRYAPGLALSALSIVAILSSMLALTTFGADPSIFNELVRFFSIGGVAVLTGVAARELGSVGLARLLVLSSFPAMLGLVLGQLTQVSQLYSQSSGAFGTFSNKNIAAAYFAVIGIASLFFLLATRQRLFAFGLAGALLCSLLTISIGGLSAMAVGLLWTVWTLRARLSAGLRFGLVLLIPLGGFLVLTQSSFASRIAELDDTGVYVARAGEQTTSLNWRLSNWERLLELWRERPIQGWGFGATTDILQPLGKQPHSEPVRFLVELGLVGSLIVVVVLLLVVGRVRRSGRGGPLALGLLAVVTVNALASNTVSYVPAMYAFVAFWQVARQLDYADGDVSQRTADEPDRIPASP